MPFSLIVIRASGTVSRMEWSRASRSWRVSSECLRAVMSTAAAMAPTTAPALIP